MRIDRSKVFAAVSACLVFLASATFAQAASFTIGGTVSGLNTGTSVTLLDNGGNALKVTANGAFTFTTALATGKTYKVTVGTQPTGETCTVTNGTGTVGTANVTNVAVACKTTYSIGGTVSGLNAGTSVTLLDNGGNPLKVTANGTFTFTTRLASGAAYKVTVSVQPTGETCTVTNGTGAVGTANVTNVAVACKTTYSIGGTVAGLNTGTSVTLLNNGGNPLKVTANAAFTFTTRLASGTAYKVTVSVQPTGEVCTVTNGTGTVSTANVTNVAVACKTTYTIGGTVSGLNTGTSVTLLDNGTNALKVTANGTFTFTTRLTSGTAYKVTVSAQPTGETCTVTNGTGTVGTANVTTVVVSCAAKTFTIGGTLSGLNTGASVTLLDNGGDALTQTANGKFTFKTALASGVKYAVTVGTQPTGETCTVTNGAGTVGTANVTNVAVACKSTATFTIGGTVSGLNTGASVTLLDNGGDALTVTANGSFKFKTALASGKTYNVTVGTQPTGETCTVMNGSGTVGTANVTNVAVACKSTATFTIGGTVSGLNTGASLTLLDNGGDALTVTANGAFTFKTALASGKTYNVTVGTQPTGETCTVTNGSGTVGTANVTNVAVACKSTATFTIGGTVSGLNTGTSVTLLDNGGDSLTVSAIGTFTFKTPIASGSPYNVTVGTQPTGETCTVTNGSGTVGSANVTNVAVACSTSSGGGGAYWIPYSATPVPGVTPTGKNGLFLIASDKLTSAPAPAFVTTDTTQLLGLGTQISTKGGLATYSPQLMMYADTTSTGTTKIFGLALANTSSVPTPTQVSNLSLSSTQQVCGAFSSETDVTQPTTLFIVIEVGTSAQCSSGGGTFEVIHYTDSATTAPAVVSINTTEIQSVYNDHILTALLLYDSTTKSFDAYRDNTFTSPTQKITGLSGTQYVTSVLDSATLSIPELFFTVTTTTPATELYRIDGATLAVTLIQNIGSGSIPYPTPQDDTNLYYQVVTGTTTITAAFYQVALVGGTPKLLYTAPVYTNATSITSYQLIGSNDSVLAFQYSNDPSSDPTKATATLYTVPVGTTTTTPTTLATYPTGDTLQGAFLAVPSGSGLSSSVLFATVRHATGTVPPLTIAYSAVSIPLNGGTAPAPIANSIYGALAIVSNRLTDSVWQVTGITDTDGGYGGGTANSVNVAGLADTPFTTTGGGNYVFSTGFIGSLFAISSNNIAIGDFFNEPAVLLGGQLQVEGVAADLSKNFLYPIILTNTEVFPY